MMSAITGIYDLHNHPALLEHGNNLMLSLWKYPADDVQIWHKAHVFLGCHAQWITPESIGERLPYYDAERQLAITADAIIDNRQQLFDQLQVDPTRRTTMTDSELILLVYYKWGEETPKYLVGDFAFMIWDERNHRLFGARDFSGSRTLYYHRNPQRFAFCTTIEPLFTLPNVREQLNEQWLAEYLAISAAVDTVDTSITPYLHIEQVPPSHSISVVGGRITLTRYCTLTSGEELKLKSNEDYVEAFQEVFREAVTSRLRTHLHVGSHLSGGLDSGAVVSFAAKAMREKNKQLHTFSYIPIKDFKDFTPKNLMPDESPFIKSTVDYVGGLKDHYLDFEGKDSFTEVDDFLEMLEMPYKYFENSYWIKGMFEQARDAGIGVLLTGGRGNLSISWGSEIDYYGILLKKLKWIKLFQEMDQYSKNIGGPRLRRLPDVARAAFPFMDRFSQSGKFPTIINPEFARRTGVYNKLSDYGLDKTGWLAATNVYEQRRRHFADVFHWNSSNTLSAKLSLRYSIWQRDPTNDIRVIRFCLSLPEEQYVQNGLGRALIRRATKDYLPDQVRLNQRIFGVQGFDWVHRMIPHWDTFIDELQQLSKDKRVSEFLDVRVIKTALSKASEGARPEYAADFDYKILMRSLIVYRFIKKFT